MDNSRHGFDPHPGAQKTPGAFGKEAVSGKEMSGPKAGKKSALRRVKT